MCKSCVNICLQISSTDVAMCIDEVTGVMQDMAKETELQNDFLSENNVQRDFSAEDLCILKAMFLELEKAIDAIELKNRNEGDTLPGGYIFELLEKAEVINFNVFHHIINMKYTLLIYNFNS